jgi:hypothetical protein
VYEKASGHKLNSAKTAIFFNKNTGRAFKDHIQSVMGVAVTKGYEKYLGLLALVVHSKLKAFASIQECVQKLLDGWNERFLSQAGKEILIKAVIQAIPTYNMSIFLLPKRLCNNLNGLISRFSWGTKIILIGHLG